MWVFSWFLFICCYIYGFSNVKPSCIHRMKWTSSCCMTFWHVVESYLPLFCWESLHLYSLKILVYSCLFWLCLYWVLEPVQCWLHRMNLPFYFIEKSEDYWCNSSLNVWQNSAMNPLSPRLIFVGRLCITASISLLLIGLVMCLTSSCFNFGWRK
jgi:hypothetical protein